MAWTISATRKRSDGGTVRKRSGLVLLTALLLVGIGTRTDVGDALARSDLVRAPRALLAPAYDTVTVSSLRTLGLALQSYAMLEGDLEGVTVAELADWGWVPSETTAVTVWVHGDEFRAVARDVRPGAGVFQVAMTGSQGLVTEPVDDQTALLGAQADQAASPDDGVGGVTIQAVSSL